ncbi:TPA: hypothetical protein N0F65_001552, partial [Lagenidium giganteum]
STRRRSSRSTRRSRCCRTTSSPSCRRTWCRPWTKTTPVQNQGACGSCWAFAAVAALESANRIKTQRMTLFSEQEVTRCERQQSQGCNGGWPAAALKYLQNKARVLGRHVSVQVWQQPADWHVPGIVHASTGQDHAGRERAGVGFVVCHGVQQATDGRHRGRRQQRVEAISRRRGGVMSVKPA